MRQIPGIMLAMALLGIHTSVFAACKCDDWMEKGGYCVDYINKRIPSFPIPQNTNEISVLKNKNILDVTEGDVAMFNFSNYWHVAYVENVRRNQQGVAIAIDVSEMNFGDQLSFAEFKKKWKSLSEAEWKRAICCGITDRYDRTNLRNDIPLVTVKQIWSPATDAAESIEKQRGIIVLEKIKEAMNRFFQLAENRQ
jgi:hypothetical protein